MATLISHMHEIHLPKHSEVLGDLGLGESEQIDEVVDRTLAAGEHVQDLTPVGFRHRVERIRGRRCSCHVIKIF
jgi:hypothetical protein